MPGSSTCSSARGATIGFGPCAVNTVPLAAIAEGATGSAPPWKSGCEMRPTCQSCRKIFPPAACTASVTLRQPATCASESIPGVRT